MKNIFITKTPITIDQQSQLAKPHGDGALEVGEHLFKGNAEVIDQLISEIAYKSNLKIIDIGCGPGYSLIKLALKFPDAFLTGVDPSPEMIQLAKGKVVKEKLENKNIELITGETPHLQCEDSTYDYSLLANVLYFWHEPIKHLREIFRINKKDGHILMYITSKKSLSERINEEDGIFHMYEIHQVSNMLKDAGFHNIESKVIKRKIGQTGYIIKAKK